MNFFRIKMTPLLPIRERGAAAPLNRHPAEARSSVKDARSAPRSGRRSLTGIGAEATVLPFPLGSVQKRFSNWEDGSKYFGTKTTFDQCLHGFVGKPFFRIPPENPCVICSKLNEKGQNNLKTLVKIKCKSTPPLPRPNSGLPRTRCRFAPAPHGLPF